MDRGKSYFSQKRGQRGTGGKIETNTLNGGQTITVSARVDVKPLLQLVYPLERGLTAPSKSSVLARTVHLISLSQKEIGGTLLPQNHCHRGGARLAHTRSLCFRFDLNRFSRIRRG